MLSYFLVFIGGGLGACLRHLVSFVAFKYFGNLYPWGTFAINIFGCFILAYVATLALNKSGIVDENLRLFLTVGFAGGFTTFSTFGYEIFTIAKSGHILIAALYASLSVFLGILAIYMGVNLAK